MSSILYSQTTIKEITEQARSIKTELRRSLVNEKYDGSKITYYEIGKKPILKEFEVTLFLRSNYTLYFNGEAANNSTSLRIYDTAYNKNERTILYELSDISSKNISISTIDLNKKYKELTGKTDNLKSIYVEYSVAEGTPDLGAVVLIFGY